MKLEDNLLQIDRIHDLIEIPSVATDFVTSICGRHLGVGQFRTVFEYNLDNKFVVKIEPLNTNCNAVEHMIWDEVKYLCGSKEWVKKWLAPVKWISPNGKILVMQKTVKKPNKKKPDKVPSFLWDIKESNFGWIGNNYVCHDYGQFYNMINYPKTMIKADWT